MKLGSIKEKIIFYRLKDKDKDAFIRAYDEYFDDIYRFVFFKVNSKEDAEDITSSVFLKAWDHILNNSISEYGTLKALFYKVARNAVIDHYRKKSTNGELSLESALEEEIDIPDTRPGAETELDQEIDKNVLAAKLNELKDEYREALVLRYLNEMEIGEMAKILDKSSGNVRVPIHRALEALRKVMK